MTRSYALRSDVTKDLIPQCPKSSIKEREDKKRWNRIYPRAEWDLDKIKRTSFRCELHNGGDARRNLEITIFLKA